MSNQLHTPPGDHAHTTKTPVLPPDAIALLGELRARRVELVLIGELAAAAYGCAWTDDSVTIVPARFGRNVDRLSRALRELHAMLRVAAGEPQPANVAPAILLREARWSLRTSAGDLEIEFEPPATAGYLDLFANARRIALASTVDVDVAALEDLIRIAELRAGAADQAALPGLHDALARRRAGSSIQL